MKNEVIECTIKRIMKNSETANSLASLEDHFATKMSTKSSVMSLETGVTQGSEMSIVVRNATLVSGYSILTKSMIGSGIFFMAFACSKFGILAALFMLGLSAALTWLSVRALSILAIEFKEIQPTFYSISEQIIPRMKWLLDVAVMLNCTGASSGYIITAGDFVSKGLFGIFHWDVEKFSVSSACLIVQVAMVVLLAPLCYMKQLTSTRFANYLGLASLLYIVVVTFVYCDASAASTDLLYMGSVLSAMGAFPTFIFAFTCHMNVFQIANELKEPTVKRMNIIGMTSTLTGLLVYVPIMILPFLTYGSALEPNYLGNFDSSLVPVQVAYILAGIAVSITYVLQVHPLRRSILSVYYRGRIPKHREELRNRIIVVTLILMTTFTIAVTLKKIDVVTNFTGLLGANTMCFVMPSILYLKHFGIKKDVFGLSVLALLVFSIALYPLCLTGIIYDMVNA